MKAFDIQKSPIQGAFLIEASAGTGKTFSLIRIVLRLLMETDIRIDQILVVTYTKAAASELKSRLQSLLTEIKEQIDGTPPGQPVHFEDATLNELFMTWDPSLVVKKLSNALDGIDDCCISTIHSFCQKMLQEHRFCSQQAHGFELCNNVDELMDRIIEDFLREELQNADLSLRSQILSQRDPAGVLKEILVAISGQPLHSKYQHYTQWFTHKNNDTGATTLQSKKKKHDGNAEVSLDSEEIMAFIDRFISYAPNKLIESKITQQVCTFDDLIGNVEKELGNPSFTKSISDQFKAVLIDEFQDTDPVQYNIFKSLFLQKTQKDPSRSLIFVGDPKQSIYRFRGADIETYAKAREDIGCTMNLENNYRSNACLLEIINTFFADRSPNYSFGTPDIVYSSVKAKSDKLPLYREDSQGKKTILPVFEYWYRDGKDGLKAEENRIQEAELIANDIYTLLNSNVMTRPGQPLTAKDIVILVRRHDDSKTIVNALAKRHIRCLLHKHDDVFFTDEAREVLQILEALEVPEDIHRIKKARLTRIIGERINSVSSEAFDTVQNSVDTEKNALKARECIEKAKELFLKKGISSAMAWLFEQYETQKRILPIVDGEKRLNNYSHIIELLQEQSRHLTSISGLTRWFTQAIAKRSEDDKRQTRLENDEDLVTVMTIHRSKGLEFPVVYLAGAWNNNTKKNPSKHLCSCRNPKGQGKIYTLSYSEQPVKDSISNLEESEALESIRLAYVAMTRASQRLVLPLMFRLKPNKTDFQAPYFKVLTKETQPTAKHIEEARVKLFQDLTDRFAQHPEFISDIEKTLNIKHLTAEDLFSMIYVTNDCQCFENHIPFKSPTLTSYDHLDTEKSRPILTDWFQSSYSALTRGLEESPDNSVQNEKEDQKQEEPVDTDQETICEDEDNRDILLFSRGPESGTFLHALFEHIDFELVRKAEKVNSLEWSQLLKRAEILSRPYAHNFPTLQSEMFAQLLRDVLCTELVTTPETEPFKLCDLTSSQKQREMTFTMAVSLNNQSSAINTHHLSNLLKAFETKYHLPALEDKSLKGFLTGAIDMVFEHQGRFYILDWKSNFLGPRISDYNQKSMKLAMQQHHYYLQYLIYCVALKRYLNTRQIELNNRNFGGVIYAFIRGIRMKNKRPYGILFEKPPLSLINCLDNFFLYGYNDSEIAHFAQLASRGE